MASKHANAHKTLDTKSMRHLNVGWDWGVVVSKKTIKSQALQIRISDRIRKHRTRRKETTCGSLSLSLYLDCGTEGLQQGGTTRCHNKRARLSLSRENHQTRKPLTRTRMCVIPTLCRQPAIKASNNNRTPCGCAHETPPLDNSNNNNGHTSSICIWYTNTHTHTFEHAS